MEPAPIPLVRPPRPTALGVLRALRDARLGTVQWSGYRPGVQALMGAAMVVEGAAAVALAPLRAGPPGLVLWLREAYQRAAVRAAVAGGHDR